MKDNYQKIAVEWLKKADSDLAFAQASLREFDGFYSQICILCHDAVEKYLKAYISFCGIKPERSHDLVALLNKCKEISSLQKDFEYYDDGCRILNQYYTPLKYPSHYPMATKEQAKEAVEITTTIAMFIKEYVGEIE